MKTSEEEIISLQQLKNLAKESSNELLENNINNFEDEFLLIFIRCRSYDVTSALQRLETLINARVTKYPKLFDDLYPKFLLNALGDCRPRILKTRDDKGCQVILFRSSYWDPALSELDHLMGMFLVVVLEMLHSSVETQEKGISVIYDAGAFSFERLKYCTPRNFSKYSELLSNVNPIKIKALHVVNAPWIFNKFMILAKVFLSKKLTKRVYTHGSSMESLHEWYSPNILPIWLKGNLEEDDAFDYNIFDNLNTAEKNEYYKKLFTF